MVRIGTRALISIDGKPVLATHWDGYPSSLGLELLKSDKSLTAVIGVAREHTIDAAGGSIIKELNEARVRELAEKHRLTETEIRGGKRRGNIIGAEDHEICSIDNYGDWAEYQYDLRGKQVYFRPLEKCWPESAKNAPGFRRLTEEEAKEN